MMSNLSASYRNMVSNSMLPGFSVLLLLSFLSMSSIQTNNLIAAVDVDTEGDGRAAAFDGEEGMATDGDSFCSITDDIEGGKFSSLFEGIVDCDQVQNQFLVEYSYAKNPVKIGEKTYLTITVKDKSTGDPISNAFVKLAIEEKPSSLKENTISTALDAAAAAAAASSQKDVQDKTFQIMQTDNKGQATFTVLLGPKSDAGLYDTEIEVSKDRYQSSFEQIDLNVVSESQHGLMPPGSNNGPSIGGDGGDGGDAVGGNAIGGDGGDGGDAVGGNAIGGDGGDGGDAVGLALTEPICDDTAIAGAGGNGGDTFNGIQGNDGESGTDEIAIC
jgi:hypothetical protein